MSRVRRTVALLLATAMAGAAMAAAAPRIHRTVLPPAERLPTALSVDESEWFVRASQPVVAAGEVTFNVYNRGMDDHDFVVVDSAGVRRVIDLGPGAEGTLTVDLAPGRHKIWCSLFEGTPIAHETLGMVAYIDARPQVGAAAAALERTSGLRFAAAPAVDAGGAPQAADDQQVLVPLLSGTSLLNRLRVSDDR